MRKRLIPPPPDEEDEHTVRLHVVHLILLALLKRDIRILHTLSLKMTDLYLRSLSLIQKEIADGLWDIRQQLRQRGIRIRKQHRTPEGVQVVYLCRGYERSMSVSWERIREECVKRLAPAPGEPVRD